MMPIDDTEATLVIHRHHLGYVFLVTGWIVAIPTLYMFGVNFVFAIAIVVAAIGGHILHDELHHHNSTSELGNTLTRAIKSATN